MDQAKYLALRTKIGDRISQQQQIQNMLRGCLDLLANKLNNSVDREDRVAQVSDFSFANSALSFKLSLQFKQGRQVIFEVPVQMQMSFYAATITVTCVATNQFVTIPHTGKLTENDFAAAVSLIDIPVEQAVDHFVNM